MNATRLITIVLGILTAGIAALGWFLGVSPMLNQAAIAQADQAVVDAQNLQYAAIVAQLEADFERIDEIEAEFETLQKSVPDRAATDAMIDEIAAAARDTATLINSTSFGEATPLGSAGTAEAPAADLAAIPAELLARLYTVPFSLNAAGTYPALVDLVDRLQLGERLVLVTSVSYTGTGEVSTVDLTGFLLVLGEALVDPAAAAPPVAETPAPTETPAP